jgi:hypothetical protein
MKVINVLTFHPLIRPRKVQVMPLQSFQWSQSHRNPQNFIKKKVFKVTVDQYFG